MVSAITTLALLATTAPASGQWLDELRELDSNHARVTALIVDLADMSTIAALNPDMRLTPASVSKLFVAAGGLEQFGPNHCFTSTFATGAGVTDGVVHGNLVFIGGGGPSLDSKRLWALVQRLKAAGIIRVKGHLIVDNGLFGPFTCGIKDRCEALTRAAEAYSAPLSSAGVNFGTVKVTIYPGEQAGDTARTVLHPLGLPGYVIDNQVTTGVPGTRPTLAIWREYDDGQNILHLRGKLPADGRHYDVYRAVTNAAMQTARVLATLLTDAGIEVEDNARVRPTANRVLTPLAKIKSNRLAEQLIPMLAYSNNYMADVLTLDIAAARGFESPLTLASASQTLDKLARQAMLETYPERAGDAPAPIFDSGSGLAVGNKLSARHIVALLNHMYHQAALFPTFYGAIAVPVSSISSTLKHGNHQWLTRLNAKTGTLTEPVTVRALAGYFRMHDGGFGAFAVIINGTPQRSAIGFYDTVIAYQEDIEAILAEY
ncbi:MAG: D-alanyl-D-alanine carboxypeptidase/D-alanyl-D-alanine-endopeptidase [Nitrococcus sp.]|nr:D-alanyl-D-alanine carboxypeptidase/D-alanyl-D-alanine-endopeptidase [Nitrococcus sp.]